MTAWGLALLVSMFVLASLPFLGKRSFLGVPLLSKNKSAWLAVLEFILAYGVLMLIGYLIEGHLGQNAVQGWAFYAVTFLLFLVAAFPAFAWRHLWK